MQTRTSGITFAVHPVQPATKPLPTCKTHQALNRLLDRPAEACCDYTADCIQPVTFHPLLAAAHVAFSQHRPLAISPDMIWLAVAQGLARHVNNHAERLRDRFVGHRGKLDIRIERTDLLRGSPENAWDGVIADFSRAIRGHLGPRYDELVPDFSTTGPVERTACEVALLDAFQPYFEYVLCCICGIPAVTLEGTPDDWQRLRDKVEALDPYDLDWWLPHVRGVCDQFVRASQGDIDLGHWRDLYKRQDAYGWDVVNGWLVTLVPYLKNGQTGNFTVRNPLLDNPDEQVSTNMLPSGISQVPFRCRWRGQHEDAAMEFLGGFVGVTQDATTLALRPKLGWAVRPGSDLDRLFARLAKHRPAPPLDGPDFDRCIGGLDGGGFCEIPGDFLAFYKHCNGVGIPGCQLRPLEAVDCVRGVTRGPAGSDARAVTRWARFCDLADGDYVALELRPTYPQGWKVVRVGRETSIVAWSFQEFLDRVLTSRGGLDVRQEGS
jgi:hypothetical protein